MKMQIIRWPPLIVTALLLSLISIAHAEDDPVKSLELRLEGSCDANNSRLWLINTHASKTIVATLRWSLANSKRVASDQFQVGATARLEIGCAAKADIVSAVFAPE